MAQIKDIKLRTEGIKKIIKVTRAMQIVAATRLRRLENRVLKQREYLAELSKVMQKLFLDRFNSLDEILNKKGKDVYLIAICSDRGLCGGFNTSVFKKIEELGLSHTTKVIPIGKKGEIYLRKRNFKFLTEFMYLPDKSPDKLASEISTYLLDRFFKEEIDKVYLVYNRFRQHALGKVICDKLLPVEKGDRHVFDDNMIKKEKALYLYEPEAENLLNIIIREYIATRIRSAIFESAASEEIARMLAMKYATDNGEELLSSLMLEYHKARQANITREIIEVVSAI
jgi:F-type H+-transporting ATPase subunit gamma